MLNWLKSLFDHPKTTVGGIGSLLGACVMGYGMSTGAVPLNAENIAITGGLASAGFAGIAGKDAKSTEVVNAVVESAPAVVDLVTQFQKMQMEANTTQEKFRSVSEALSQVLPADIKQTKELKQ